MEYNNPKALNLEVLEDDNSGRKVTLGFKCSPKLKLQLATEALEKGYSLSEYVESITESYVEQNSTIDKLKAKVSEFQAKVDVYEKSVLVQTLLTKYKGKSITIKEFGSIEIQTPYDVICVIFKSFKFEQK